MSSPSSMHMTGDLTHVTPSGFLRLPLEIRLQIYSYVFLNAPTLTLRSLFIRAHYINVFMTQQPKGLCPSLLRVCRQVADEASPLLYGGPRWICGCRVEALAVQIGAQNFAFIKQMGIDVDDLDMLAACLQRSRQRSVHRESGYAMQMIDVVVPRALRLEDDELDFSSRVPRNPTTRSLNFSKLEVLEVEGFQSAALNSRGTHRVRVEALRLCELAMQIIDFHPQLKWLLQENSGRDGGADARDLTLGRVRWRFVKELDRRNEREGRPASIKKGQEHLVDLGLIRSILEFALREDERAAETSLPIAWISSETGRFNLYPFLQPV